MINYVITGKDKDGYKYDLGIIKDNKGGAYKLLKDFVYEQDTALGDRLISTNGRTGFPEYIKLSQLVKFYVYTEIVEEK